MIAQNQRVVKIKMFILRVVSLFYVLYNATILFIDRYTGRKLYARTDIKESPSLTVESAHDA